MTALGGVIFCSQNILVLQPPPPPSLYARMHIFRHVLFAYFASLSSGPPILVQVFLRELRLPVNGYDCVTEQGVFLDQKSVKECEDWQKGLLLCYK